MISPEPTFIPSTSASTDEFQETSPHDNVIADVDSTPGPGLVPELLITSVEESLDFWCRLCGFEVLYDRPKEG